jgi:16S rRNA processing protein RimM
VPPEAPNPSSAARRLDEENAVGSSPRLVALGRLVAGHGVRGLARVKPFNRDSPALLSAPELWLSSPTAQLRQRLAVRERRRHQGLFLIGFQGIDSLDALEPWIGGNVEVEADQLPPPGESAIYQFQAIGLEVRTLDGRVIGTVREVMTLPASDVWVVRPEDAGATSKREHLIPVVGSIVHEIDLAGGFALIDPLPGLLDD